MLVTSLHVSTWICGYKCLLRTCGSIQLPTTGRLSGSSGECLTTLSLHPLSLSTWSLWEAGSWAEWTHYWPYFCSAVLCETDKWLSCSVVHGVEGRTCCCRPGVVLALFLHSHAEVPCKVSFHSYLSGGMIIRPLLIAVGSHWLDLHMPYL